MMNWYHPIQVFIAHHVVAISVISTVALIAVIGIQRRGLRNPRLRGPALVGRARVLSVEQTGGRETALLLRVGLRVEVPGHTP